MDRHSRIVSENYINTRFVIEYIDRENNERMYLLKFDAVDKQWRFCGKNNVQFVNTLEEEVVNQIKTQTEDSIILNSWNFTGELSYPRIDIPDSTGYYIFYIINLNRDFFLMQNIVSYDLDYPIFKWFTSREFDNLLRGGEDENFKLNQKDLDLYKQIPEINLNIPITSHIVICYGRIMGSDFYPRNGIKKYFLWHDEAEWHLFFEREMLLHIDNYIDDTLGTSITNQIREQTLENINLDYRNFSGEISYPRIDIHESSAVRSDICFIVNLIQKDFDDSKKFSESNQSFRWVSFDDLNTLLGGGEVRGMRLKIEDANLYTEMIEKKNRDEMIKNQRRTTQYRERSAHRYSNKLGSSSRTFLKGERKKSPPKKKSPSKKILPSRVSPSRVKVSPKKKSPSRK